MGRRPSSSSSSASAPSSTNSGSLPSRAIPSMRRRRTDRHWGAYVTSALKKYPCMSYSAAAVGVAAIYVSWTGGGQGQRESFTLEVRRSTIPNAGLGVFLATNSSTVAKGTVLTVFGERMVPAESTADSVLDLYALRSSRSPHLSRVGDPWVLKRGDDQVKTVEPNRPVGHMLNDAQAITLPDMVENVTVGRVKALVDAYEATWEHTSNVQLLGDGTWRVVAARDLRPAEELFYSYGAAYWLKMILRGSRDPLVRLSLLLFTAMHDPQRLTGDALVLRTTFDVVAVLKTTGEVPSEEWCNALFAASLSLSPDDIHAYDRQGQYGWGPGMSCNDRLQCLARMVGRA